MEAKTTDQKIDAIYDALTGTELNPNGLIPRIERLEKYQARDKKQKWVAAGGFSVLGVLAKFWDKLF